MDEIKKLMQESSEADKLVELLKTTDSMSLIADTVESISERMTKLVLKKFIYSQEGIVCQQE